MYNSTHPAGAIWPYSNDHVANMMLPQHIRQTYNRRTLIAVISRTGRPTGTLLDCAQSYSSLSEELPASAAALRRCCLSGNSRCFDAVDLLQHSSTTSSGLGCCQTSQP